MRSPYLLILLPTLLLAGAACAVRDEIPMTTIALPPAMGVPETSPADFESAWWRQFDDPVLDSLVEAAFSDNRDLHAAASRYASAMELAGAAALLQMPRGGPAAGVARQHLSAAEAGGDLPGRTVSIVEAGVGVAWEADLFGRLRGARRAAAADARVAEMDVRGVQVAMAAQVAAAYFELRGAEADRALMAGLQERTRQELETTRTLLAAGRVTRLDVLRAQQVEEELGVGLSVALHRAERALNRLATLTGRVPGTFSIPAAAPVPLRAIGLPIGTPAELLRRRPDVASAEFRFIAATARAGIARANLFPRVDVTGTVGLVAGSLGRITEAAAGSWLVAPRLVWNAFDWPRLRREMAAAGAWADAAFAEYEQAVLRALEESRSAIDAYAAAHRELQANERRARAAAEAASVVFIQYREGLVDSLARTQAERDAIAGALDANGALTAQRQAMVDVYRVLGGGWR